MTCHNALIRTSCLFVLLLFTGCATRAPLPSVASLDLDRFMGAWYVVGYTPIIVDKQAHNPVEHYTRGADGKILATYQFREGSFDGPMKTYRPTAWVHDQDSQSEWRMQFIWPFKAQYIVLYRSDDYQRTIIAHPNRKYAWIMQRSPEVDEAIYADMLDRLIDVGYDVRVVQRAPHDWSQEAQRLTEIKKAGARIPLAPR